MNWEEMALVGRIARPHGVRGQVVVNPDTDFLEERYQVGTEVFVNRSGTVQPFTITAVKFHLGRPIVALDGVEDMDAARELAGLELRVPADRLTPLPEGVFYRHDLIGCTVETPDGTTVGVVEDVEGSMGASRLIVSTSKGEVLIPLVTELCPVIDPGGKRIVVDGPEGLLDLNVRPG